MVIRDSYEATKLLHHKRTGDLMASRKIANNTKLIFVDAGMVFLRLHQTNVAKFTPNGVVLDTRTGGVGSGWFTATTFDRIDSFTQARTFQENGLRYIHTGMGWVTLYTHGLELDRDGLVLNPMPQPLVQELSTIVKTFRPKARRYAARLIRKWDRFDAPNIEWCDECDRLSRNNAEFTAHLASHIQASELVWSEPIGRAIRELWNKTRAALANPTADAVKARMTQDFQNDLADWTFLPMMRKASPDNFNYPQVEQRQRRLA